MFIQSVRFIIHLYSRIKLITCKFSMHKSIIINIIINSTLIGNSTFMRRRSGGIHSDSQKQYIKLADVAQVCNNSLFYDENVSPRSNKRRKYAFSETAMKMDFTNQNIEQQKSSTVGKAFLSFDFDQQSYNFSKDCGQLKKLQQQIRKKCKKCHYVILSTKDTYHTSSLLTNALGIQQQIPKGPQRVINLLTHRYNTSNNEIFIDCFWIIDKTHLITYQSIFDVYLSKSSHILDLTLANLDNMVIQSCPKATLNVIKGMIDEIQQKRMKKQENTI